MIKQYIVDAFTDRVFGGNPAAVCVLDAYPDDALMMNITLENNLSETAFAVPEGDGYHLRWFTPGGEIDFCGHATLATGFTILNFYQPAWEAVTFHTMSGDMVVSRAGDRYEGNFCIAGAEMYANAGQSSSVTVASAMAKDSLADMAAFMAAYGDKNAFINWSYSFGDTYDFATGAWTGSAADEVVDTGKTVAEFLMPGPMTKFTFSGPIPAMSALTLLVCTSPVTIRSPWFWPSPWLASTCSTTWAPTGWSSAICTMPA